MIPLHGAAPATSAGTTWLGSTTFDVFGNRADLGDGDGDGRADVAAGAPRQDDGGETSGTTYVFYAPEPGVHGADETAGLRLTGEASDDFSGYALYFGGDFDGGGTHDLLVGARQNDAGGDDAGAAYRVDLPLYGTISLADAAARYVGEAAGDHAGRDVYATRDRDGDGRDDVLVTAPFHDPDGRAEAGAVYLVSGAVDGVVPLAEAPEKWTGEAAGDHAGLRAIGFGDADGDGLGDLAIGAEGSDRAGADAGAAFVVTTPIAGVGNLADADAVITGEQPADAAGASVAPLGDLDGDGLADLEVTADDEAGTAYVVLAPFPPTGSLAAAHLSIAGTWPGSRTGNHVVACDPNGDGAADLVVAAHEAGPGEQAGRVYTWYGPLPTGAVDVDDADAMLFGSTLDNFGQDLACADTDGDAVDDLLVGAEGHDGPLGGFLAGAVFLYPGHSGSAVRADGGCGCASHGSGGALSWAPLILLLLMFRRGR